MAQAIDIFGNGMPKQAPATAGTFQAVNIIVEAFLVANSTSTSVAAPEPRVIKTIGVCGGKPRIAGTRLSVWVIEAARRIGCSDREILKMYPAINRRDLQAAQEYVRAHSVEIDRQITENEV